MDGRKAIWIAEGDREIRDRAEAHLYAIRKRFVPSDTHPIGPEELRIPCGEGVEVLVAIRGSKPVTWKVSFKGPSNAFFGENLDEALSTVKNIEKALSTATSIIATLKTDFEVFDGKHINWEG